MVKSNYKSSKQRSAILTLLRSTKTHPTAAWLFERLRTDIPGLSLGTVYRNLSTLKDQGLLQVLSPGDGMDRFDADVSGHYHVVCEGCGKVDDLPQGIDRGLEIDAARETGYTITSHRVFFYGICPGCAKMGYHPESGQDG
jgi:Fur family peroxide stress response transcriptional regulator